MCLDKSLKIIDSIKKDIDSLIQTFGEMVEAAEQFSGEYSEKT